MTKIQEICVSEMNPGDIIQGFFLINNATVKTSNNGSQFLSCKLADNSGEVEAKMWDYKGLTVHEHSGTIVKVRGSVQEYNGAKQIIIERVRPTTAADNVDLSKVVPSAPIDAENTFDDVEAMLKLIKDPVYKAIADAVMDRIKDDFKVIPAGKSMHHSFLHGLLMHTYNMMQMAVAVGGVYGEWVNTDLLLLGTFCHDMAKRNEFVTSEIGLVTGYSVPGNLLGHLVMGAMEIDEIAKELQLDPKSEKVLLLEHMLLSHHGQPEYGAAVVPKLMEAEILSRIDDMDARIEMYREALNAAQPGEMTDWVKGINRPIYKPEG